jgi:hypothetical protein
MCVWLFGVRLHVKASINDTGLMPGDSGREWSEMCQQCKAEILGPLHPLIAYSNRTDISTLQLGRHMRHYQDVMSLNDGQQRMSYLSSL